MNVNMGYILVLVAMPSVNGKTLFIKQNKHLYTVSCIENNGVQEKKKNKNHFLTCYLSYQRQHAKYLKNWKQVYNSLD